ncbi:MAG: sigma-70 family RNA polymerase sigma factor [Dehalococcoidia bacterium]|nr:sigma-70 family RNA polymerase sigma factor [Dehalococcoidia bacterium]MDH4299646.1 sigma-70 family RNA polymerase sigma factor [Dehalococcoidia bacterium]MDH4367290.1 sigma-70 family RNA polymerase sigma factor [Dehalococcoidia bacterium]
MNIGNRKDIPTTNEYKSRLADLYEEYYDKVARYVYVHIGNKEEAEDIAGEVFLKALKSLESYRERGVPMQGWLFRIAHNLTVDYVRKMDKRRTMPADSVELVGNDNPVDTAQKNIEFEQVTEAMKQLTTEQREVINLRFLGGLTSKEAADILGKSDGAVREMQRAAIEKLRGIMGVEK